MQRYAAIVPSLDHQNQISDRKMNNSYQILSLLWALFVLFGYGFAGGPNTSTPMPLIEIVGFFVLAFVNFRSKKIYGFALLAILFCTITYQTYTSLQSPYLTWDDVDIGTVIPLSVLLFSAFSIWRMHSENNK